MTSMTHFLCVENTPHTSLHQRVDRTDRRHCNSISTCGSSNSGPLHAPAKGVRPKAWQEHLSEVLQQFGLHRSTAEPNIYMTAARNCFVLAYVDNLLFLGEEQIVNKLFKEIQQHLLLRPTGTLSPGNTVAFFGRNIINIEDHNEVSLADDYVITLLAETNLQDSKPAPAPGISALKTATADQEPALSTEEHAQYRRAVGKLQWLTYTRPDSSYSTKELARALQQPTTADQQQLKHLLKYIKGTKHYKEIIRPTVKLPAKATSLSTAIGQDVQR